MRLSEWNEIIENLEQKRCLSTALCVDIKNELFHMGMPLGLAQWAACKIKTDSTKIPAVEIAKIIFRLYNATKEEFGTHYFKEFLKNYGEFHLED